MCKVLPDFFLNQLKNNTINLVCRELPFNLSLEKKYYGPKIDPGCVKNFN